MAQILNADGRVKTVKNLGWLLRNWQNIARLEWVDWAGGKGLTTNHQNTYRLRYGGVFRAYMRDGRTFATAYASFDVWKGFINRPVFRGLKVTVNGIEGEV